MTKNEAIEYGKNWNKDIIMVKGERYVAGTWDEEEYAIKCGFTFVGTIAELSK